MGCYGWTLAAAVVATWIGAMFLAGRLGIDRRKAAACYLAASLAMVVGARGLYWATQPPDPKESALAALVAPHPTRFALFGGLVAGGIVGAIFARATGVDPWRLADAAAPALGVGIAMARLGCFVGGCCFGLPTSVPWAIIPQPGCPAHLAQLANNPARVLTGVEPIHPTQLYELAAALVAALVAAVLIRRRAPGGVPALVAAMTLVALRWCVLPLRDLGPTAEFDGRFYPVLYAGLLVLFGCLLWKRTHRQRQRR